MSAVPVTPLPTRADRRSAAPVLWPWLLVGTAWVLALAASLTNGRKVVDHRYLLVQSHWPWVAAAGVFLAGWQVMVMGMMLPTSVPMLSLVASLGRTHGHPRAAPAAFLAGYALVWTAFGLVAFAADTAVHRLVAASPWLAAHASMIGGVTFAIAGGFQFCPLEHRCLADCRGPLGAWVRSYRQGLPSAWRLGLRHGLHCLGWCWALMLVMFGVGMGSLVWMAVLAGAMVLEKEAPRDWRITSALGIVLLALAGLWLAEPTWLALGGGV